MGTKKRSSIVLIASLAVISLSVILFITGYLLPDKINKGKYKTEIVDRGKVVSTTKATGVVESENEVLVLSPATSVIQSILKKPGDFVEHGEVIVRMNTESVEESIGRMKNQLEVKKNNLEKAQLNAQSAKLDQDYNEEVKRLRIESLQSQLADQEQLLEVGGISPSRVEQTRQQITQAESELNTLVERNSIRVKQLEADEKGLMLQIKVDEQSLADFIKLLSKMNVQAPSSGVILNINGLVGQKINADATLVQLSDLSSYKVIGSIDENLSDKVKTGTPVTVILNNDKLQGQIGLITPAENNKIQFDVHLKQSSDPRLFDNQNVLIEIANNEKDNVLRVKKRPEFAERKIQIISVKEGNKTVEKEVVFGIIGDNYCEVLSGLSEGDVILSENFTSTKR